MPLTLAALLDRDVAGERANGFASQPVPLWVKYDRSVGLSCILAALQLIEFQLEPAFWSPSSGGGVLKECLSGSMWSFVGLPSGVQARLPVVMASISYVGLLSSLWSVGGADRSRLLCPLLLQDDFLPGASSDQ